MINGTYTVTVKTADGEDSKTAEVTSQHVDAIKILNTVALTCIAQDVSGDAKVDEKDENSGVLVYYDVVDQYGESMKNSTTIEWSASCKVDKNDKTNGVLTLIRTDKKAFTYGESIYVTGVHAKTGKSISATLTVGAKQALNTVEVKGFVKKGTSEILKSLPAGFKSQAYYLVYSVLDQNGNKMTAKKYMGTDGDAEVTFVSDNILVLKEITKTGETVLTLDGEEYCAAFLVPGIDVNKGGEVNITAIANKTGNKSNFNVAVGNNQILKSFTMNQPSGVVADGERVEIPFTAVDQDGKEIKNFVTLASQSDFNRLQLNASSGWFTLSENDDGTATLAWQDTDPNYSVWNANSEDGIDRPISLTAVVVGGETANEMIYVQDMAMPVAIKSVDAKSVYVQRSMGKISLSSFTFLDQYGRTIDENYPYSDGGYESDNKYNANKGHIYDNGFFAYVNQTGLSGTEFGDYKFGVAVEFKGSSDNLEDVGTTWNTTDAGTGYAAVTTGGIKHIGIMDNSTTNHFSTGAAFRITSKANFTVCADQTLKFSIEKIKKGDAATDNNFSNVSPIKNHTFKGVNINRVSGFEIKDLNTFYVNTGLSKKINGAVGGLTKDNITSSAGIDVLTNGAVGNKVTIGGNGTESVSGNATAADAAGTNAYFQRVAVTGKFDGVTVDVPADYFTVAGNKLGTELVAATGKVSDGALGKDVIDSVSVSTAALKASDLYDANTAQFTRKLAEDTLKVTVYQASGTAILVTKDCIVNTATKKVAISDAAPYAATICAADSYTVKPRITTFYNLVSPSGILTSWSDAKTYEKTYYTQNYWKVLDQYGVELDHSKVKYAFKITDVKENADRYADNNFTVDRNDTKDATIRGAECGDTFVLTIYADDAKKEIKMTVGSDHYAEINASGNVYSEYLVDMEGKNPSRTPESWCTKNPNGLEKQRTEALGSN